MINKLKETALNDLFLAALVIYCSGWVLLILYVLIDSFFYFFLSWVNFDMINELLIKGNPKEGKC